jgi:hypothetical protein
VAPVIGSVTPLAKMALALVANVVGMMDRAMRWDAATDNARYRVLWSCLGTWMEWVFLLHGIVVVAGGETGTTVVLPLVEELVVLLVAVVLPF